MLARLFLSILLILSGLSISFASEAYQSTLNVCNNSADAIYFMIAHKQGAQVQGDEWKVQGVYDVLPNNCMPVFKTNEQIQAFLTLIKVKDGKAENYRGNYFANGNFAKDANRDICVSYKSFKYFTSEQNMGKCEEGFIKSKSFIFLDIEPSSAESVKEHRIFIE